MTRRLLASSAAALLASGCGDDQLRTVTCVNDASAFDIEQVSALELVYAVTSADGSRGGGDAVILDADRSQVPAGGQWKVGAVEVLVAIPDEEWADAGAGTQLSVQVWDGDRPGVQRQWTVTQTLDPAKLAWERGPIKRDRFGFPEPMRRAWWKFDFSGVIPDDAMASPRFMVGVRWPAAGRPYVGGSEFNRDCQPNWSDYADGEGWVPNTSDGSCNWPMFRVAAQTITTQVGECQ